MSPTPQLTYAVDFESYYDKECSITTLGPVGYFSHPKFDAYMVSVEGSDGFRYVGDPKKFDWTMLNGHIVLSHNASFDEALYNFGVNAGWFAKCVPDAWHCTADMAAYLGLPRSLAGSTKAVFGDEVSKDTRDAMKGQRWDEMTPEFQQEVIDYAAEDSVLCLKLWQEVGHKWPEREREISRHTRVILSRGLPIDVPRLQKNIEELKQKIFDVEAGIPWAGHEKLLSRKAFNAECRKYGLEPPASLAKDNPEAIEWMDKHGETYEWVRSVQNYRRMNAMLKKLENLDRGTMADGRYYGGMKYFGGHTGRWSGSGGNLNLQNLTKGELFGVDMRRLIKAPEGKKLVVVDLSQIEVRTLMWLADAKEMLKEIAETDDIYETFAIRFNMWDPSKGTLKGNDDKLRHRVKGIVLGCGYGCGVDRFAELCGISEEEAAESVSLYRTSLHEVPALWDGYGALLKKKFREFVDDLHLALPSGRAMSFRNIKQKRVIVPPPEGVDPQEWGLRYKTVTIITRMLHGRPRQVRVWGGVITENMSQALARDIFAEHLVKLSGVRDVILHVHDEIVIEVDEADAPTALREAEQIMSVAPEWIPDIPLSAEGDIMDYYQK